MTKTKTIRLDEETEKQLNDLDNKMNLKPNYSAVIRLAIQRLYEEEMKEHGSSIRSRTDQPDRHD